MLKVKALKSVLFTVRVKGGMSLQNGMWKDVRNDIIMQIRIAE